MSGHRTGAAIRWRLHLARPRETVFALLDSERGRAAFWAESAPERDGRIEFRFANGQRHSARILGRQAPMLWSLEYFGGPAEFRLSEDGRGGTDLELVHRGVAEPEWIETHAGWLNVLLPLKAWLEHGVDLRNHDPARTWDQGYVDQ